MLVDTTFIYALKDPETGAIRYIGKSNNPKKRLSCHLAGSDGKCYRTSWIKSLSTRGLRPILEIVDEVNKEFWPQLEVAYIEFFLEQGCSLVNSTVGGEGGCNPTPEARKNMSEAHRGEKNQWFGKKRSPEFCAKISAALTGKKFSPERCAKHSAARIGQICQRAGKTGFKKQGASSSFYGVSWTSRKKKWHASIRVNRKQISLGNFSDEIEAAEVYDIAAKIHHGAHAVLNFPD